MMMAPCDVQVRKGLRVQTSSLPSSGPAIKLMDIAEDIGTVVAGLDISNKIRSLSKHYLLQGSGL